MTQQTRSQRVRTDTGRPLPTVPPEWYARGGSDIEYFVYTAILRTGRREYIDFEFQRSIFGGRLSRGGAIADFFIYAPRVGINVQGARFHLVTAQQRAHDTLQRIALEGSGIRLEFISEQQAINDPDTAVREAIAGVRTRGPQGV